MNTTSNTYDHVEALLVMQPERRELLSLRLKAAIPWVFLLLVLTGSLASAWTVPPFMMPDEQTHVARSDMMTFGPSGLSHTTIDGRIHVLGRTHASIFEAAAAFEPVKFHADQKVGPANFAAATARFDGRYVDASPAASLDPILYLPSAAAMAVGCHFGWTVLDTLYLARLLNALICVGVGFAALTYARETRLALFAVLTLPMTVTLFAAVSQDGLTIALTALATALISRAMSEGRPLRRSEWAGAAVCLGLVGMAKLPYALLALALLGAPATDVARARWAAIAVIAVSFAWAGWTIWSGWSPVNPPGMTMDPVGQVQFLKQHPWAIFRIASTTIQLNAPHYAQEFIGVLGWLDTDLPSAFYTVGSVLLCLAFVTSGTKDVVPPWRAVRWLALGSILLSAAGVFGGLYVTWTSVGGQTVEGVQGRYLLPLALVLPLLVAGPLPARDENTARSWIGLGSTAAVLVFAFAGLIVTQSTLIERYYPDGAGAFAAGWFESLLRGETTFTAAGATAGYPIGERCSRVTWSEESAGCG